MTITITESHSENCILLKSNNTGFIRRFGKQYAIRTDKVYKELQTVADYVNNVLHQECLFEVD